MTDSRTNLDLLPHAAPDADGPRLLLFAIRRIAAGGLDDAHVVCALIGAFGLSYRRPLVLLRALMAELSRVAERKLMVAPCCCLRTTRDEATLLGVVGTALDDPHRAHRHLGHLLATPHALGALGSAQAVGQAFADLGRPLG